MLAIISLVFAVVTLIATIANGQFASSGMSGIITLVIDALMFWVANNIKIQAGK